jgi:hypothetical protein
MAAIMAGAAEGTVAKEKNYGRKVLSKYLTMNHINGWYKSQYC